MDEQVEHRKHNATAAVQDKGVNRAGPERDAADEGVVHLESECSRRRLLLLLNRNPLHHSNEGRHLLRHAHKAERKRVLARQVS